MKISLTILAIAVASVMGVGSQLYISGRAQSSPPDPGGKPVEATPDQIAANGVVEGIHPEADLRLDGTGLIAVVHVREDQEVRRGTVLLELDNDEPETSGDFGRRGVGHRAGRSGTPPQRRTAGKAQGGRGGRAIAPRRQPAGGGGSQALGSSWPETMPLQPNN